MIVAVCSDTGSPGVTTLALTLAMAFRTASAAHPSSGAHPNAHQNVVVLEADPSGADLPFWARRPGGEELLAASPSTLTMAADARRVGPGELLDLAGSAQPTAWGTPVIPGSASAAGFAPARPLWPAVAQRAADWPGLVVADLGRTTGHHDALVIARAAAVVLVVARFDVAGLFHLRERVGELTQLVGPGQQPGRHQPAQTTHRVAVVVQAPRSRLAAARLQTTRMLTAAGIPVPVAGMVATDPKAAELLRRGLAPRRRTALVRSVTALAESVRSGWLVPLAAQGTGATPSGPALNGTPTDATPFNEMSANGDSANDRVEPLGSAVIR